jgi:hypothetical protein
VAVGEAFSLGGGFGRVAEVEAGADEENGAGEDGCGAGALGVHGRVEVGQGDGVVCWVGSVLKGKGGKRTVWIVVDVLGPGICPEVDEERATGYAVLCPVVDSGFVRGIWAYDVGGCGVVVKGAGGDVGEVPESVELGSGLRVEVVEVVVGDALGDGFDFVFEGLAAEGGRVGDVEWETGQLVSAWICGSELLRRT